MKIPTLLALLGAAACTEAESLVPQADADDTQDTEEKDNSMSQLITSALAGAKPGIINTPKHTGKDKEMDKTVTKGKAKNYKFHW